MHVGYAVVAGNLFLADTAHEMNPFGDLVLERLRFESCAQVALAYDDQVPGLSPEQVQRLKMRSTLREKSPESKP